MKGSSSIEDEHGIPSSCGIAPSSLTAQMDPKRIYMEGLCKDHLDHDMNKAAGARRGGASAIGITTPQVVGW